MRNRKISPKEQAIIVSEKLLALLIMMSVVLVLLVLIATQVSLVTALAVMIVLIVLILVIGGAHEQLQGTLKAVLGEIRKIVRP